MPRHDPPPGPRPLPATQRLIVRYAKRGRLRFASHRDIARAVERGVRKAGLPIALSAGFTPHPKISYAGAAPTGTASEAEYLELSLTEHRDASDVRVLLDAALPDGIDVIDVLDGPVPLADLPLEASEWEVVLPGVQPAEAARAVSEFLALTTAEVERLTNKGRRRVDARAAVITMEADRRAVDAQRDGNAILRMVVRHVIPAVRPDDILAALHRDTALAPASPPKVTRLVQGPAGEVAARLPAGADRLAGPTRPGAAAQPPGQGAAPEQVETTRPGSAAATAAAAPRASAYDQFPRGAEQPGRAFAPGSLTGDCPDARTRAEQRVQQ
ncbi:MAG: TIGR03936 family radical SAM-associated protein [Gemmatimonadota bacterium]